MGREEPIVGEDIVFGLLQRLYRMNFTRALNNNLARAWQTIEQKKEEEHLAETDSEFYVKGLADYHSAVNPNDMIRESVDAEIENLCKDAKRTPDSELANESENLWRLSRDFRAQYGSKIPVEHLEFLDYMEWALEKSFEA